MWDGEKQIRLTSDMLTYKAQLRGQCLYSIEVTHMPASTALFHSRHFNMSPQNTQVFTQHLIIIRVTMLFSLL